MPRAILLTCILSLLLAHACAQTDTVYYNSLWQEVDSTTSNYRVINQLKRRKYIVIESHGNEYTKAEYKIDDDSKLKDFYSSSQYLDGEYSKYTDGSLVQEGAYVSGLKNGVWNYYKAGTVIKKKSYEYGVLKEVTANNSLEEAQDTTIYSYTSIMPSPKYSIKHYINKNLVYPEALLDDLKEARVVVTFIVDEEGQAYDIRSQSKDVDPLFQKEAIRLVSIMPDWNAGKNNGVPVKVKYALPVKFEIKYLKDTCYFDEYWQPVSVSVLDTAYYRVIDDAYGYPYYVVNYYKNGTVQSKGRYIANQREELKESSCNEYRVGKFIDYYQSGYKQLEAKYNRIDIVGKIVSYYDSSDIIERIGVFKDAARDSTWVTYYPTGKVESIMTYDSGTVVNDAVVYYPSGQKRSVFTYKFGKPIERINYNEDGTINTGGETNLYWEREPFPNYNVNQFLAMNINYPDKAKDELLQGRVLVKFLVDEKGNISEVKAIRSKVDRSLAREAERVVASMPKWQPGFMKGKPVKAYHTLPIVFKIHY